MSLQTKLLNVFRRHALDREFDEELSFHIARRTDEYVRQGMSPAEADAMARSRFGDLEHTKQQLREAHMINRHFVGGLVTGALLVAIPVAALLFPRLKTTPSRGFLVRGIDEGVRV